MMSTHTMAMLTGIFGVHEDDEDRIDLFAARCFECGGTIDPFNEARYYCKSCKQHFDKFHGEWHSCQGYTPDGDVMAFG